MFVLIPNLCIIFLTGDYYFPNPIFILAFGLGVIVYQTMDNMDGKQARKTGSSSPLGMVFDHGFDAINASLQMLSISKILMLGPLFTSLNFALANYVFYLATYET